MRTSSLYENTFLRKIIKTSNINFTISLTKLKLSGNNIITFKEKELVLLKLIKQHGFE